MLSRIYATVAVPYDQHKLQEQRLRLLTEMQLKGYMYYQAQLTNYQNKFARVLRSEEALNDDFYWNSEWAKGSYWETEAPWLNTRQFWGGLWVASKGGVARMAGPVMASKHVSKFLGDTSTMPIHQVVVFRSLLTTYFHNHIKLWPIALNMDLVYQLNQSGGKKFGEQLAIAALSGGGPVMLKVLQQLSDMPDQFVMGISTHEATKTILDNVPGLQPDEEKLLFTNLRDNLGNDLVNSIAGATLGSASIAEAHGGRWRDMPAVIKFIKPMYIFYFMCEIDFILTVVWRELPSVAFTALASQIPDIEKRKARASYVTVQCRQLLVFLLQRFAREFDYQEEFNNTILGATLYQGKLFRSSVPYQINTQGFPVLVQGRLRGVTLQAFLRDMTEEQRLHELPLVHDAVKELFGRWLEVVLWKNGWFHADLHPGNLMWDSASKQIAVFDYGSCGHLSAKERDQLLDIMMTVTEFDHTNGKVAKNRKIAARFIKGMSQFCGMIGKVFVNEALIDALITSGVKHGFFFGNLFLKVIEKTQEVGTCVSNDMLIFGRGISYLTSLVAKKLPTLCVDKARCSDFVVGPMVRRNITLRQILRHYLSR